MALSNDLISQLVKATKPNEKKPSEGTVYGTVVDQEGGTFVQLDGSGVITPVTSTVKVKSGERVIVSIKNHSATITGNLTTQSARSDDVDDIVDEIAEVEILIADKVSTEEFDAVNGRIENLISDNVLIRGSLTAVEATIGELEADNVVINEKLTANEAAIETLEATSLTADIADLKYASIDDLEAVNGVIYNLDATYATIADLNAARADINDLEATKLSAEQADLLYANIDFANIGEAAIENFFSKSGMIDDLIVSEGKVTGTLVGVTIIGDMIKGGTVQADKLVIKGEDGLYYKLNLEGGATTSEQVTEEDLQNGLSGSIIVAKSITAEKVAVDDLVAFGATIGGFHITDTSLYSGAKASATNTTRGVYQDADGQFAVGDANNYLKFYKDSDGTYKLAISAASMTFSATGKNVEETIQDEVDKIEVGGRNYLLGTGDGPQTYTFSGWQKYLVNAAQSVTTFGVSAELLPKLTKGQTVTLSANLQNTTDTNEVGLMFMVWTSDNANGYRQYTVLNSSGAVVAPGETGKAYVTATIDVENISDIAIALRHNVNTTDESTVIIDSVKLELGNKPTDWTLAPEDVSNSIGAAQNTADFALTNAAAADSAAREVAACLATLVTDANGASLMTQTDSGWTFSIGEIESALSDATENIDSLAGDIGETAGAVESLKQAVNDLGVLANYIKITVDGDQPCIELGESENNFKVRITNTEIHFADGSVIPTRITRQMMIIEKAMVRNELQFGDDQDASISGVWIWKRRSNGNLGLMWKEVSG